MGAQVQSIITSGSNGTIVDIECHLSNNLPTIVIVGFANKAVGESKERIRGAFASSLIMLPRKRITVNLAPADVPKADSGFDLAIAVAILLASGQVPATIDRTQAFIGELGLDGSTRAVRGIIGKLMIARSKGIKTFYISSANLKQAQLVPSIILIPVDSLRQLFEFLSGKCEFQPILTGDGKYDTSPNSKVVNQLFDVCLSEIVGQDQAKRALEIAAAGGHNVFLSGPPGTGKSMLAKALPSMLPPLNREEVLEITQLRSLASHDYERIVTERPFRAPHHSASHISVIGGGTNLRPGEISLAHRGILFLDELPEFDRSTLEALRQPLEDRVISIARAKDTACYPANFMFIATANPCPCGFNGTSTKCRCMPYQVISYRNKLSGPILDRIDLHCNVHEIKHERLLTQEASPEADIEVTARVSKARSLQSKRFGTTTKLNTDMSNSDIKQFGHLDADAKQLLDTAGIKLNLSARSYMRTVKVARTIADLETSTAITTAHISEALAYRTPSQDD